MVKLKDDIILKLNSETKWELAKYIQTLEEDQRMGVAFLLNNMYDKELAHFKIDVFIENIKNAYLSKRTLPWGERCSDKMFLSYVLPYRITCGRIDRWRQNFYNELYPRIKRIETVNKVAVEINKWGFEKAKFKERHGRIKKPNETIKNKSGDCMDLSVLYVAACRSLAIPSRVVYVPWILRSKGGPSKHAWSEIWDGKWYYLGSCEPSSRLNRTWFTSQTNTIAKAYTFCYQKAENELGFSFIRNLRLKDITDRYTDVDKLKISVSHNGNLLSMCQVDFFVPYPDKMYHIASTITDMNGSAEITLGTGVEKYYVSASFSNKNNKASKYFNMNTVKEIELKI